jgi:hypothetical protein
MSVVLRFFKHNVSEPRTVSFIGCKGGKVPTQLGPLEKAGLDPLHLMMKRDPISRMVWLEKLDDRHVQNISHAYCNTESSETFGLSGLVCIWEVFGSNPGRDANSSDSGFRNFPQYSV